MELYIIRTNFIIRGLGLKLDRASALLGKDFNSAVSASDCFTSGPRKGEPVGIEQITAQIPGKKIAASVGMARMARWLIRNDSVLSALDNAASDRFRKISIGLGFQGPVSPSVAFATFSTEWLELLANKNVELGISLYPCFNLGGKDLRKPTGQAMAFPTQDWSFMSSSLSSVVAAKPTRAQLNDSSQDMVSISNSENWDEHLRELSSTFESDGVGSIQQQTGRTFENGEVCVMTTIGNRPYSRDLRFGAQLLRNLVYKRLKITIGTRIASDIN